LIYIKMPALTNVMFFRMAFDTPAPPLCPGEPMKLVKTLSHLGGLPKIWVFYCSRCKQAETKVQERTAA
jgi:hypothetical protein